MTKLPPPKTPPRPTPTPVPSRRTPGAGLHQLFPDDEEPTAKRAIVPVPDRDERVFCPACRGSTFESIEEVEGPSVGQYRVIQCGHCLGDGEVSARRAEEILNALTKK